jgi:acyl carrier protein
MTDDIYPRLTEVFREVFDEDDIVLKPETTAEDIADWDSLSHIRLVLAVSKAFNVKFTAAEVSRLENVGEFVQLIHGKMANT